METAWYSLIIGYIYLWPLFTETRYIYTWNWVVFRFINVIIFVMEDYIAAFYENVCIYFEIFLWI